MRSSFRIYSFFQLLLIWGGLGWVVEVQAQEKGHLQWGAAGQQGAVIVHSPKIRHLGGTRPTGLELNLQYQTTGSRYWQQLYRYPRIGLSLNFLEYHNLVIGRSLALSPYLSLPAGALGKGQLRFRFGTGLCFFSNNFDRRKNPGNNIISTTWNAVLQARLENEWPLGQQLRLLAGLGINHYSNGGGTKPNLGINVATATLGLTWPGNRDFSPAAPGPVPKEQKTFFAISTSVGRKQRNDFDTLRYIVQSVATAFQYRVSPKSSLILGLEGFYDPSLFPRRAWDPRVKPGTNPDIRRLALNAGHELYLGRLAFGTQVGWYFYRPYKSDAATYQRLETRYYVHKNVFLAAGLKLHDVIKADVIEYRLGLRI